MKTTKYNSALPAKNLFENLDHFFNNNIADFFGSDFTNNTPSINIVETEKNYRLEVAAPGLEKNDFEVKVEKNQLIISANRATSDETTDGKYTRREFNYASFRRSFELPELVNKDHVTASYDKGVLTVTLPKKEEIATVQTIEIK